MKRPMAEIEHIGIKYKRGLRTGPDLVRANVQASVHLHRVCADDFPAERLGQGERDVRLSDGSRSSYHDYFRLSARCGCVSRQGEGSANPAFRVGGVVSYS